MYRYDGLRVALILSLAPAMASAQTLGGGGSSDVVSDTSPQLGGELDVNEFSICDGDGDTCMVLEETADADVGKLRGLGINAMTWDCSNGTDCVFTFEPDSTQSVALVTFAGIGSGRDLDFRPSGTLDYYMECGANCRLRIDSGDTVIVQGSSFQATGELWFPNVGTCTAGDVTVGLNADLDTGLALTSDNSKLCAGGVTMIDAVESTVDYVEILGCRDYGSLASPPTPNGACDRYYDTSGAFCVYNGSTWDSIGSGSCA